MLVECIKELESTTTVAVCNELDSVPTNDEDILDKAVCKALEVSSEIWAAERESALS